MPSVFHRYRLLVCVVVFVTLAALWERSGNDAEVAPVGEQLPYVMHALYPESPRVQYVLGIQSVMNGDLQAARQRFEQALASGETTNEDLLYYYAVTLVYLEAPEDQIDAAIDQWRFHHPYSNRDDPRKLSRPGTTPEVQVRLSGPPQPGRANL